MLLGTPINVAQMNRTKDRCGGLQPASISALQSVGSCSSKSSTLYRSNVWRVYPNSRKRIESKNKDWRYRVKVKGPKNVTRNCWLRQRNTLAFMFRTIMDLFFTRSCRSAFCSPLIGASSFLGHRDRIPFIFPERRTSKSGKREIKLAVLPARLYFCFSWTSHRQRQRIFQRRNLDTFGREWGVGRPW